MGNQGDTLIDFSGNGADGVMTGIDPATAWIGGLSGQALSFDGVNDQASTPAGSIPGASSFTMLATVMIPGSLQSSWRAIMEVQRFATNWRGLYDSGNSGANSFHWRWNEGGGSSRQLDFTGSISPDVWYRVGGTYDAASTTGACWLDGVQNNVSTSGVTPSPADGFLRIGQNQDGGETMKMNCENIRMYNRALTAREFYEDFQDSKAMFRLKRRVMAFVAAAQVGSFPPYRRHMQPFLVR